RINNDINIAPDFLRKMRKSRFEARPREHMNLLADQFDRIANYSLVHRIKRHLPPVLGLALHQNLVRREMRIAESDILRSLLRDGQRESYNVSLPLVDLIDSAVYP